MEKTIVRYTVPTKLEKAPYKTQCQVMSNDNDNYDVYIQISQEDEPRWLKIGDMLERAFSDFFSDQPFVNECLRLFHYHEDKPLHKISQIITEKERKKL